MTILDQENTSVGATAVPAATNIGIDPSDPLYLHLSDNPGAMLISVPFSGIGYRSHKEGMDGYWGSSHGTNCATPSIEIFYDKSGRKINLMHYEENVEGYDGCLVAISNQYATNFITSSYVEWLGLSCISRESPYKFWGERVDRGVMVTITKGDFKEVVWCDVYPMKYFHVRLGKPWFLDHNLPIDVKWNSCFVSCVGNFEDEPSNEVQSTLKSLEEDQSTFLRGLMELNEKVQGKENTLDELQDKIAYPSTLASLVDCGDTLSLTDSYDIDEFDISLTCDEKNNCGLQLAKSSCALLDDRSSLFNDSLASDDVESYDKPPLWDDECDNSFDSTLTLLEESFELYEEMSQEECVDEFFDSISIPLEERFNFMMK
ncbi:hypothetical protein A4A49_22054 [Nicotiana attenuata]|uniref:Uncharacterized protein n=1 Tax=Nicotiana attenuata TaxID=49451 RepID=A0A1J6I4U9_NICAT|nr:hypothetical protein A4A49_22054 [Nicotiana attenuata]